MKRILIGFLIAIFIGWLYWVYNLATPWQQVIIQATTTAVTCTSDADCSSSQVCIINSGSTSGYCSCSNTGCQCSDGSTCSSGICSDDVCQHCVGFGEPCSNDGQCCSDYKENWCTGICGGAIVAEAASMGVAIGGGTYLASTGKTPTYDPTEGIGEKVNLDGEYLTDAQGFIYDNEPEIEAALEGAGETELELLPEEGEFALFALDVAADAA